MPKFSLIIATLGRTTELKRLLSSLMQQQYLDFEVLIVDQNNDNRLVPVLNQFDLPIRHLRCGPGVSKARNVGFLHAAGEIIAFPDDDCWYYPDLLLNVDKWFHRNPQYAIFAVGAVDEDGVPSGNRWVQSVCDLHPINIFRTTFCSSLFIRSDVAVKAASFDEMIGPGPYSKAGCGEETDFVLQLMKRGLKGRFDRSWYIGHPRRDMLSNSVSRHRAIGYGSGMAYVLRKHSMFSLWLGLFAYDVFRAVLVILRGRLEAASLCIAHAQGLLSGYSAATSDAMPSGS